uniref:Uncharacterized protein n=1 Tax=Arundo donax TaxID=35708 RepID=A0A0A9EFI7_ARUDO
MWEWFDGHVLPVADGHFHFIQATLRPHAPKSRHRGGPPPSIRLGWIHDCTTRWTMYDQRIYISVYDDSHVAVPLCSRKFLGIYIHLLPQ